MTASPSPAATSASTGRRSAKLPPIFKVSLANGKSISVVRRDILDSALGRGPKK